MLTLDELMVVTGLLLIHWGPLLLAARRWPFINFGLSLRSFITVGVSILSCLIALFCVFLFTDVKGRGTEGHGAGWYIIFSVVTFGILPAFTIAAHVIAGRFIGFTFRRMR